MKISKFAKYVIFCVILNVTLFTFFYLNHSSSGTSFQSLMQSNKSLDLKYILIWTSHKSDPILYLGEGRNTFLNRGCSFTNCYVSLNRQLLKDVADFDVILFHGPELDDYSRLPQTRSPHQKYVFASMESSVYYPVCYQVYDSYFNWTWTYKLNSDVYYGYMSIRDKEGKVIGPNLEMHWEKVEAMMPINDTLKAKLSTKKIAVAWFVSNCDTPSDRKSIAMQLKDELAKYHMEVDIIGRCGTKSCPKSSMKECLRQMETDYYFYLSFENSICEDYVTEKLLHALNHYAVPVVFGGANYTRFMPDGIYLSAQPSTDKIKELAKDIANIIDDKEKYYDFFKWHNHYSYHDMNESPETDAYCNLCALINNNEQYSRTKRKEVYEDFSQWWCPENKICN